MKTRFLMIVGIVIVSVTAFFLLGPSQGHIAEYFLTDEEFDEMILNNDNNERYLTYDESNISDDRADLKEIVYASTICSTFWRTNLFDMWKNKTHDYKNDSIYQECREMLDAKNRCLDGDHIWNHNGTCTLTSVYPGGSGMGFKYGKYVSGTLLENEN